MHHPIERSLHKLEQYFRRECVETAGIQRDILHVIFKDVIKLLDKIDLNLTKRTWWLLVLNREHVEQIITNKCNLNGMNFLDVSNILEVSNTNDNVDEETLVNSLHNALRRNPRIYINYS